MSRGIGEATQCITPEDPRFEELGAFIDARKGKPHEKSELIPVLHHAQTLFGYIAEEAVEFIATRMNIPRAQIYGVATFYHLFSLTPRGKFRISLCLGTACYVKGAGELAQEFKRILGLEFGEATADGIFSLECARCIGACGQAPVLMVNDDVHTRVTIADAQKILNQYQQKVKEDMAPEEAAKLAAAAAASHKPANSAKPATAAKAVTAAKA
ncbi:MAG: NAD(P)H-dependent oxidoreductase subunit E [Candidatus Sumerlaeota bacterium]|nr:NAD(P)H-dependent oxidoreductase subunit E [Candidatus Sumerlaeota bacterium]